MSLLLLFQGASPPVEAAPPLVQRPPAADDEYDNIRYYAHRNILRDDKEIMELVATIVGSGILDN